MSDNHTLDLDQIMACLEMRMKLRGHEVIDAGKIDSYGDLEIVCPRCEKTVYVRPTADERRKRVFIVNHLCHDREPVTWHVRRELSSDEILGWLRGEYPDEQHTILPIRSDN